MKEIIGLLIHFRIKALLIDATENSLLQFLRYIIVGGVATIVDWSVQYFATVLGLHYLFSAVAAFAVGLVCNFLLSKLIVFNSQKAKVGLLAEFMSYGIIGAIGLGITVLIMYIMTDVFEIYFMISKVVATFIVLFWNYMARKIVLYKK